ncbi:hypothetical protein K1719_028864 [Acacia pycnantha]|nr:hypothetical protein K1719_028864 [Acacia pycnantha]
MSVLVVLLLVVALSDSNVLVHGESHVKVVNNLEGHLNLTLSCEYYNDADNKKPVESVLGSSEVQDFSLDRDHIPFTAIDCTFKWPGASHLFAIYVNYRDYAYCRTSCTWSIKQDQPCMIDADNFPDLNSCQRWET